jgi:hypothetical protein
MDPLAILQVGIIENYRVAITYNCHNSASCRTTFNMPQKAPILPGNEAVAQCTGDVSVFSDFFISIFNFQFSDISPLTGGVITFATLHGRFTS